MKQAKDIMTTNPACCMPENSVEEAAQMMVKHDCGEIPVVESKNNLKPIGVITDRDITCRVVATSKNPKQTRVRDAMSSSPVTVKPETSIEDCCRLLEKNQIRRVPVVDQTGRCCGMVSQADIAKAAPTEQTAEVLKQVSEPSEHASRVAA
ncbi:MAG: CBS domain-containing protein [Verrucomicrobia bacterium]|nr:MAG: CBS domain-containing protein [Verrucomicrobiota bacterium]